MVFPTSLWKFPVALPASLTVPNIEETHSLHRATDQSSGDFPFDSKGVKQQVCLERTASLIPDGDSSDETSEDRGRRFHYVHSSATDSLTLAVRHSSNYAVLVTIDSDVVF